MRAKGCLCFSGKGFAWVFLLRSVYIFLVVMSIAAK